MLSLKGSDKPNLIEHSKQTLLISVLCYDETASVRVLLYTSNFVPLSPDLLD